MKCHRISVFSSASAHDANPAGDSAASTDFTCPRLTGREGPELAHQACEVRGFVISFWVLSIVNARDPPIPPRSPFRATAVLALARPHLHSVPAVLSCVHLAWPPWSGRIGGKAVNDKEKDATPETRATVSAAASSRRGIEAIWR